MKTTIKNALGLSVFICISLLGCSNTGSTSSSSKGSHYTKLGIGYLQKGRLDLATLNLEKALKRSPRSADTHHYYALLQQQLGNSQKATKHFRKAIRINPKDPDLLNNYGSWQCKNGQYTEAEKAFLSAASDPLYRTPEFAYTNAGICVGKDQRPQQAEDYLRQALKKNNRFPEALYQMAKLNYEKGNDAKAEAFLYRYNEVAPARPDTLLLCYQVQTRLDEGVKAEACATKLRAAFPDSQAASLVD